MKAALERAAFLLYEGKGDRPCLVEVYAPSVPMGKECVYDFKGAKR